MVYFLGMLAEVVIRVPHEQRRRQTRMKVESGDWSERPLLGLMFVGMFFIPLVYTFSSQLDGAEYRLPREARESAGGDNNPRHGGVAVLALTRRPRAQLVALARATRGTRARYRRRVPIGSAPDVRFHVAVGRSAGLAAAKLDCGLGQPGDVHAAVPAASAAREADDARRVRRRVPCVYEPYGPRDPTSWRLGSGW